MRGEDDRAGGEGATVTIAVQAARDAAVARLEKAEGWANEVHFLRFAEPLDAKAVREVLGRVGRWVTEEGHPDSRDDAAIDALAALLMMLTAPAATNAPDAAQARADRLRRADNIEALAERIACSPLGASIYENRSGIVSFGVMVRKIAADMIDAATKAREVAERDSPPACVPGCVRLASEGPGHPGACSTPGRQP